MDKIKHIHLPNASNKIKEFPVSTGSFWTNW